MKKRLKLFTLVLVLLSSRFLTGCFAEEEIEYLSNSTRIIHKIIADQEINKLEYIKGEHMYSVNLNYDYRPALDWTSENIPYGEPILTWWTNGHMIQGYSRKQVIATTPCFDILETTWNVDDWGELSDCNTLTSISYALLADTPIITKSIMKKNNASWIFVTRADRQRTYGMVRLLGDSVSSYIDEDGRVKSDVLHKTLFAMSNGESIDEFNLEYADDYVYIYKPLEDK